MALFRLHRRTWEKNSRPLSLSRSKSRGSTTPEPAVSRKRPRAASLSEAPDGPEGVDSDEEGQEDVDDVSSPPPSHSKGKAGKKGKAVKGAESFPGGGRKGVSSGLSTIIKRAGGSTSGRTKTKARPKEKWWKELGGGASGGSKGSVRLKIG